MPHHHNPPRLLPAKPSFPVLKHLTRWILDGPSAKEPGNIQEPDSSLSPQMQNGLEAEESLCGTGR